MAHVALTLQQPYAKQHRVSNVARPSERLLLSRGQGAGRTAGNGSSIPRVHAASSRRDGIERYRPRYWNPVCSTTPSGHDTCLRRGTRSGLPVGTWTTAISPGHASSHNRRPKWPPRVSSGRAAALPPAIRSCRSSRQPWRRFPTVWPTAPGNSTRSLSRPATRTSMTPAARMKPGKNLLVVAVVSPNASTVSLKCPA